MAIISARTATIAQFCVTTCVTRRMDCFALAVSITGGVCVCACVCMLSFDSNSTFQFSCSRPRVNVVIRRTGELRPTKNPNQIGTAANKRPRSKTNKLYYYQGYHDSSEKYKRNPPKGMYINHDDVLKLAAFDLKAPAEISATQNKRPAQPNDTFLVETDRKIEVLCSQVRTCLSFSRLTDTRISLTIFLLSFPCQLSLPQILNQSIHLQNQKIQTNKQKISAVKAINAQFQDIRTQTENNQSRLNSRWTNEELPLAKMALRKFGKNFKVRLLPLCMSRAVCLVNNDDDYACCRRSLKLLAQRTNLMFVSFSTLTANATIWIRYVSSMRRM